MTKPKDGHLQALHAREQRQRARGCPSAAQGVGQVRPSRAPLVPRSHGCLPIARDTQVLPLYGFTMGMATLAMLDAERWELYHAAEDFSENYDVAAENRGKVIELIAQWYVEAGRYKVLPIDGSVVTRLMTERPSSPRRGRAICSGRAPRCFPPPSGRECSTARTASPPTSTIPAAGAEGVLLCQGANNGGFVFYVKDQRLHYAHNYLSRAIYQVSTPDPLPEGSHRLRFEFEPTGEPDFPNGRGAPGRAQLYVDDQLVAQTDIPVTVPIAFNPGGLSCGSNPGAPIVTDYRSPFRFTGTLHRVTVDVSGELIIDSEAEMRMAMSRQ